MNLWREAAAWVWRPRGPLPRPEPHNLAFDGLVVLLGCVTIVHYAAERVDFLHAEGTWSEALIMAVTLVSTLSLLARRRFPLAVLWIVMAAVAVTPTDLPRLTYYQLVLAAYSAAVYSPYLVPTVPSLGLAVWQVASFPDVMPPAIPVHRAAMTVIVPIVLAAIGLRFWKMRADSSRARLSSLELRRAGDLRHAAEAERSRIARELHDVVTHNVSMMVIQAGAARKVLDASPEQAREAMRAVEDGGRAALTELRHTMGLLTVDEDEPDLAPQPGLGMLDGLVARVTSAGLPVSVTVAGDERALPAGVDLTAYRVVQEALTNAMKYAVGSSAAVTLDYGPDRLRIAVADTGGGTDPAATGNGRGLIGLRQRLDMYGGSLRSGREGGGFAVEAVIPWEAP